jgi:hypothetical protein
MRAMSKFILASTALFLGLAPLQAQAWTKSNVNGSYGFRLVGLDNVDTHSWIVGTGVFVTNGKGGISSGSITYNDGSDVCIGSINQGSSYTVASDGEGTLTIMFTMTSGTCPIIPTFEFAIALANPNNKATPIAQTLEMNSTLVTFDNDENSSNVMIYGAANAL